MTTWSMTACGRLRACLTRGWRLGSTGYLCIGCLERRLGRELTIDDLTLAPINDPDDAERLAEIKRQKRQRPGGRYPDRRGL